jgi:hypothetical protein
VGQLADELGRGYGLEGNHHAWAATPESQLGQQIAARLRSLLDNTTAVRSQVSSTDAFFGEREGLGISLPPQGSASHRAGAPDPALEQAARPANGPGSSPPSSLRVPLVKRPIWLAVVAATALLAGVVLALLLFI